MTGPSEVDPAVLAGEPGSASQLEGSDDGLPGLGQDPDEWAEDDASADRGPGATGS